MAGHIEHVQAVGGAAYEMGAWILPYHRGWRDEFLGLLSDELIRAQRHRLAVMWEGMV